MSVVSMNYLLEAGVHFGHQTKRWNPKMKEYIFTARDEIYIIDLQKTAKKIEEFAKLELSAKAGESGKLFGTITTKKLTEELLAKSGIEIDRKNVSLNAPINKVGEYTMLIKLTSKVKSELKVVVTASEVVKESIEETEDAEA